MSMQVLQPADWPRPKGFANGIVATGRHVFIAGQVGWDSQGRFPSKTMAGQVAQALSNVLHVLAEAGGAAQHIVRLTWYVTDCEAYRQNTKDIGSAYRAVMGKHFPVMSVVQVIALVEREALVEIEATAMLPERQAAEVR